MDVGRSPRCCVGSTRYGRAWLTWHSNVDLKCCFVVHIWQILELVSITRPFLHLGQHRLWMGEGRARQRGKIFFIFKYISLNNKI